MDIKMSEQDGDPQGLKPASLAALAARLKPCPSQNLCESEFFCGLRSRALPKIPFLKPVPAFSRVTSVM
jgi:hypothetical protein